MTMAHWTHDRLKAKKWNGQYFTYAHAKYDGHRITFFKQADGSSVIYGRKVADHLEMLSRFPRLYDTRWYKTLHKHAPKLSSIDAEIYVPGKPASIVPTALRDPSIPIDIMSFAIPYWDNRKCFNVNLDIIANRLESLGLSCPHFVEFSAKDLEEGTQEQIREKLMLIASKQAYEGWVLKDKHYSGWYKVKAEKTVDAIIIGIKPGKGRFKEKIGAIKVAVINKDGLLQEIASVSGMDDVKRRTMTLIHNKNKLIGRVVEVAYQEVTSYQNLRHPRFKRYRSDKPKKECTIDQLD